MTELQKLQVEKTTESVVKRRNKKWEWQWKSFRTASVKQVTNRKSDSNNCPEMSREAPYEELKTDINLMRNLLMMERQQ